MVKKIFIILSVIITISPFLLLHVFYESIPEQIPIFFDIKGNPSLMMNRSVFPVFRLPLMGLMIQIICFTMLSVKLDYERDKNQLLWLTVSFLAALKMSLTSMEVLIYDNALILNFIRTIVIIVIFIAVVTIAYSIYILYMKYNKKSIQYFSKVSTPHKALLFLSFTGYLLLVLFPIFF